MTNPSQPHDIEGRLKKLKVPVKYLELWQIGERRFVRLSDENIAALTQLMEDCVVAENSKLLDRIYEHIPRTLEDGRIVTKSNAEWVKDISELAAFVQDYERRQQLKNKETKVMSKTIDEILGRDLAHTCDNPDCVEKRPLKEAKQALYQRLASEAVEYRVGSAIQVGAGFSADLVDVGVKAIPLSKLKELFGVAAPKSNVGGDT